MTLAHPTGLALLLLALLLAQGCSLLIDSDQCATDAECQKFAASGSFASCQAGHCELLTSELDMRAPPGGADMATRDDMRVADMGATDMTQVPNDMSKVDMLMGPKILEVQGSEIKTNTTWRADTIYLLKGKVFVSSGVRLTVEAGTQVRGEEGSALIVRAGGSLTATGTAAKPVIFTSSQPPGSRTPGDWGGIALLGNASVNGEPAPRLEGLPEADNVIYGGNQDDGSCGNLQYVRIEFAGEDLEKDKELNGLTLAGCGSGTLIDHVQVHLGKDDGVEIFGGTADIRHVVITRPQDDGLDLDKGWRGRGQFIVIQQDNSSDSNNAMEISSSKEEDGGKPRTDFRIYNVTMVGPNTPLAGKVNGVLFKEGTAGVVANAVIIGMTKYALDLDGKSVVPPFVAGTLRLDHPLVFNNGKGLGGGVGLATHFPALVNGADAQLEAPDGDFDEAEYYQQNRKKVGLIVQDPLLNSAYSPTAPNFVPMSATAVGEGVVPPKESDDFFDQSATYRGALNPTVGAKNWMDGWTAFPDN